MSSVGEFSCFWLQYFHYQIAQVRLSVVRVSQTGVNLKSEPNLSHSYAPHLDSKEEAMSLGDMEGGVKWIFTF